MEFKEEPTGQAMTSSSDVTAAGAPSVSVNQPTDSVAPVTAPVDTAVGQPQSTTSPAVESPTYDPAGPIHTTQP